MSRVALLDVNLLVALFDPDHVHHEFAHDWFADHERDGWATCALTENGFVRVLANPSYGAAIVPRATCLRWLDLKGRRDGLFHIHHPDIAEILAPGEVDIFAVGARRLGHQRAAATGKIGDTSLAA
jgi:predicted nucleic acid-binding protein